MITRARVRELMCMACEKNDLPPGFADKVRVEFKSRFTARMGDANYTEMRVRFSTPLFNRASAANQENTVVHEMCHIIARHKYLDRRIKPHGYEWQLCMLVAGYQPERCHKVDRTGLKRTTKTMEAKCLCMVHKITPKMWANIYTKKQARNCRRCKGQLVAFGAA